MAKRRKKGTALPRLTLLAYSRSDLLRFTEAVERLVGAVHDLQQYQASLPKPRKKNVVPTSSSLQPESSNLELLTV